ncbi:MAG: hypothetical protein CUN53_00315 [Phototrophicales bacterium]|nr:MAG: hypothetical protein CUN53_00315 [Phototrophicales bacterium]
MTKESERLKARQLRLQGYSVREIAAKLQVAKSSVSLWVRDIVLSHEQVKALKERRRTRVAAARTKAVETNRQRFLQLRQQYQSEGRVKAREGSALHLVGCMLYWAEGAKNRSEVIFVNSDPEMMRLFVHFLRVSLGVTDEELVLRIYCRSRDHAEIARMEAYWLELLKLPPSAVRKAVFKTGSKLTHNHLVNGICRLTVKKSFRYAQHIFGAIQEYGGFDRPAWLA